MSSARLMTFGSVLIIAAMIAGAWFLGIYPKLTEAATANVERLVVEAQNAQHQAVVTALQEQSQDLPALQEELAELRSAIPTAAALNDLISELNRNATAHGVTITSMMVADPVPYLAPPEVASDAELARASAALTADNFLTITVNLDINGTYDNVMAFVSDLQTGQRLYLVHALDLLEGAAVPSEVVTLTTTGQVFVLLGPASTTPTAEPVVAESTE